MLLQDLFADDVAHRGVGVLALDVVAQAGLVVGQLALQGSLVEVLHPALRFVDRGALLGGAQQGLRVQRDGGLEVHAGGVAVLLVAGVQGDPGVARAHGVDVLACLALAGAAAGRPVDVGLDPDVFQADGCHLAASQLS